MRWRNYKPCCMPPEPSSLLSENLWPSITSAAKESRCLVAVAYVGRHAPELLPLQKGSILVCDFSRAALERGLTNPDAIRAYLKAGVEVHSWENLHAKVFSFGDVAYVGSCNVSSNSANVLKEAALRTTDPIAVNDVSNFVLSLRGSRVGPQLVEKMARYYRPPKWESDAPPSPRQQHQQALSAQAPLWIAVLSRDGSELAGKQANKTQPHAAALISDTTAFELKWFEWTPNIPAAIRENSGEIILIDGTKRSPDVSPPARFLRMEDIKGKASKVVRVESPVTLDPMPRTKVAQALGPEFGKLLQEIRSSHLVKNSEFALRLRQLW